MATIAIRCEDKAQERRSPVAPEHVSQLREAGIRVRVQGAPQRVFSDAEYAAVGAEPIDDLTDEKVIMGIKEIELDLLEAGKTYIIFSHTVKGQRENMPLLQRAMEVGCTLIDYERIVDDQGQRLVFFGRFAGLAGTIDSLWALGKRFAGRGLETPLAQLSQAYEYDSLAEAEAALRRVGEQLRDGGVPPEMRPLVVGVAGTGNTGQGARTILDALGAEAVPTDQLAGLRKGDAGIYQVFFDVHHLVARHDGKFDLAEYFKYPYRYRSIFDRHLPHLTVLMNCIYWENRYPRLVTVRKLNQLYRDTEAPKLQVIGDISCDIRGSIEATVRATWPDDPVYTFDVDTGAAESGFCGNGPAIMAVYNLPAELPRDASMAFGDQLMPFLPAIARADFSKDLDQTGLPGPVERAVVVHRGELMEDYAYLEQFL
ncbi:MAG: hypothetical protein JRH20_07725 [Deltaproteobacteria bacterium]|nr:hypothetical protein [Deltaproteobacteria bacterium]